ncbi:MAG: GDP-fucose synthetase [Omnitrophica WOR_2 bacterium GWA2_47_8]|nr:MAG: GDP-fucose synthetase [Omnitrophica WOR_2 bacterium GWA2_47_8]
MNKDSSILVVGHNDVVERSFFQYFQKNGFANVFSSSLIGLNTTIQSSVYHFFAKYKPDYVFLTSVRSGGIEANQKYAGEFIYHNLESQNNVVYAAQKFGTKKFLYVAASCMYPKDCAQPMKEEYFLTGAVEPTSEAYSVAKIAGVELCRAYRRQYNFNAISVVPATVYGPESDMDLEKAHVMGALIAKFHKAKVNNEKEVIVWGTGDPRREFLYVDDFVQGCVFLMQNYNDEALINLGCGYDVSITELAGLIKKVIGYHGKITFDLSKPDGAMKKLLDTAKIKKLGWGSKIDLEEGIKKTYEWLNQTDLVKREA